MRPSEVLEKNRQAIREATRRFNAANPRVFGSVARGEDRPDSDIDILVDPLPGTTLFDLGGLLEELEQMMKPTPIHLVLPGDFPEEVRKRVLSEARPV
ncbi:nucleotidyltransferase family protein [Rhizobium cremeum]|uniref:nucleotidyltransferase family protein n=1 Tax=Rhizobium cremeum TaxID=2813827 RepID=UPI000DD8DF00|nr:nucleotidyltransferase family protein [Rhizobium cremeum]MCJ7993642.1 nucleotidyltransferase family protein [Rhizobium cremeum]MCJ7998699.1 nucleotidyltransferase family protein [Rhizobium cremeum]